MTNLRRWLLILSAFGLGGGSLFAADPGENQAFAAAAAAFHDELWPRAEAEFAGFVQKFPQSTNAAQAVLFQAQAEFKQGRFDDAGALLANAENLTRARAAGLADQFVRWLGEAQFGSGKYPEAANTFAGLVEQFPDSLLSLGAVVEAAAAYEKLGAPGWAPLDRLLGATNGVYARTARLDPDNELVAAGRLLLAQSRFSRNDFAGAEAVLRLLNPHTLTPDQDYLRLHLLCRVKTALNDLDAALAATTNLTQVARLQKNPARLAASVALHGRLLEKMNLRAEAVLAWEENLTNAPPERQSEAVLRIAALAAAQKNYSNTAAMLDRFLAQYTNSPAAGLALLTAGELCLQESVVQPEATNLLAQAREKFDRLLAADTNGPFAGRAFLGRGWCSWRAGKTNESLADFRMAAETLPPSEDLALAKFKIGDALFVQKDFTGARTNYQSVLTDFGNFPAVAKSLGDRALYQILRADLKLEDMVGAEAAMRQLLAKYPSSELADNSLLLVGEALSDFGSPANAFRVFRDFARQFPDSPLRPEAEFVAAQTFERQPDWPAAVTNYEGWLKMFPTNELRPQVEFALAQAHFHAGDETNAFQLFSAFIAKYPTNELAPQAQWWLADDSFRAGFLILAETNYENIFQNPAWKNSSLFYPAQLMAGRVAMARQSPPDAIGYFTKLINDTNFTALINDTNGPPELKELNVQARFACVAALMQAAPADTNNPLANLQTATNLLYQICQLHPADETGARARGELGDCALQMNDYDTATNAYAQVVSSPAAGPGLRNKAQVGWGLVLEKKAALLPAEARNPLLMQALEHYWNVLYDGAADPFWAKKAGLQALPLMELTGEGSPEKLFDRLESLLPPLKDSLEKKKAAWNSRKE